MPASMQATSNRIETNNVTIIGSTLIVIGELYTTREQGAPITIDVPSLYETARPAGLNQSACDLAPTVSLIYGRGLTYIVQQTNRRIIGPTPIVIGEQTINCHRAGSINYY